MFTARAHDNEDVHVSDRANAGAYEYASYLLAAVPLDDVYVFLQDDEDDRDHATGSGVGNWQPAGSRHDASEHGRYRNSSCS